VQSALVAVLIAAGSIALSLAGLHLIRARYPHPIRQANNEVAGFFLAVLGVVYAVLLAFVVLAVWEQFEDARFTAEHEANALAEVYRTAGGLAPPTSERIRALTEEYARTTIEDEWSIMGRGQTSPRSVETLDTLWETVLGYQSASDNERLVQGAVLRHLEDLSDNRQLRLLAAQSGLPRIMWGVLVGGAMVTVAFTYFFSTPNSAAQYLMTALYVASISFVLVLIGLLDFPFTGDVQIRPEALENVQQTFERLGRR
jgi:hypothetical protein